MTQSGQPSVKGMGIFELIFWTAIGAIILLVMYGVVVIFFRQAFGVELPNPLDWATSVSAGNRFGGRPFHKDLTKSRRPLEELFVLTRPVVRGEAEL
jgi:hypothetical protein